MDEKRRKKKKKKSKELPNRIMPLPNADKTFHEKWYEGRNLLNFPHPFRAVIISLPNCGKTCIVKNILMRQDPPFKTVYVCHIDGDFTKEYDDIEPTKYLEEIPPPTSDLFDGKSKTLIIMEDLEYKFMPKAQLKNLDRLMGYVSTHKNVSVCILSQDAFNIPVSVRRMSNIWILGKYNDLDSLWTLSRKSGVKDFRELFPKYVRDCHDYLWIDNTKNSPAPLRQNGYKIISTEENNML